MAEVIAAWRVHMARAARRRAVRERARLMVRDLFEGRPKVLRLPAPRGRLDWWIRPGTAAHLAVWLPDSTRPGRWRWHLVCRHSRRRPGWWWRAIESDPRCQTCARLPKRSPENQKRTAPEQLSEGLPRRR
jgi:hypothetical protein